MLPGNGSDIWQQNSTEISSFMPSSIIGAWAQFWTPVLFFMPITYTTLDLVKYPEYEEMNQHYLEIYVSYFNMY